MRAAGGSLKDIRKRWQWDSYQQGKTRECHLKLAESKILPLEAAPSDHWSDPARGRASLYRPRNVSLPRLIQDINPHRKHHNPGQAALQKAFLLKILTPLHLPLPIQVQRPQQDVHKPRTFPLQCLHYQRPLDSLHGQTHLRWDLQYLTPRSKHQYASCQLQGVSNWWE